ncbi:MAG TPA: 3-oxoacyl-ACP reductase FabG [Paludibacteraceae bacterium]|nr:3-oxoacyl-ACP reductase FabG [Paludibacteraceae bacterium]HOU67889.1 3-oxoacyl-ACP reductase FabG [Paludibacteraceae bacterium]HPH62287.1 3-oxoacyl-ACP reductase FabG [Paludibacteraceae bacterium]HQF49803.1 3-oxoacyl-ACP reductase FabG [Paludibacteraceae bacterium]HQJ90464.1 3-oxoacyl-ACP reductase FabG [Paludibacteraceae bacterium]
MKVALVTGGSRGIGRACSVKLAEMGYYVLVNYQSNETEANNTLSLIREKGSDGEILRFDVSKKEEVEAAIEQWQEAHPDTYIEVLVNNAGVRRDNLMVWMTDEDWNKVLDTSLNGFMYITRVVLKNMLVKKYGRIVNMASLSGLKGLPGQTNYSAAKGAIIAATKALAQEVAKKHVTVNAVAPGFIRTDMTQDLDESQLKALIPMGHFGNPEDVSEVVGFLASKGACYVTGQVVSVNGGLYT